MRFWDSSAIVPVLVEEPASERLRALAADRATPVVWWATGVECASAIARRERSLDLTPEDAADALATLDGLAERWAEVPPTEPVRDTARRLVRVHELRAADAFQLSAALVQSEGSPGSLPFVTLDERLALAASREGFPLHVLD